jgi:hypothetical protein
MTQYAGRISTKERRLGRLSTNDGWETRHSLSFQSASPFAKGEDQGEGLLSSLFPHNRNLAKAKNLFLTARSSLAQTGPKTKSAESKVRELLNPKLSPRPAPCSLPLR